MVEYSHCYVSLPERTLTFLFEKGLGFFRCHVCEASFGGSCVLLRGFGLYSPLLQPSVSTSWAGVSVRQIKAAKKRVQQNCVLVGQNKHHNLQNCPMICSPTFLNASIQSFQRHTFCPFALEIQTFVSSIHHSPSPGPNKEHRKVDSFWTGFSQLFWRSPQQVFGEMFPYKKKWLVSVELKELKTYWDFLDLRRLEGIRFLGEAAHKPHLEFQSPPRRKPQACVRRLREMSTWNITKKIAVNLDVPPFDV